MKVNLDTKLLEDTAQAVRSFCYKLDKALGELLQDLQEARAREEADGQTG